MAPLSLIEALADVPVKGRIILGDALFCQRDVCAKIVAQGGDYLFTLQGNQLGWQRDMAAGFAYEANARSIAAAFSPSTAAAPAIAARV